MSRTYIHPPGTLRISSNRSNRLQNKNQGEDLTSIGYLVNSECKRTAAEAGRNHVDATRTRPQGGRVVDAEGLATRENKSSSSDDDGGLSDSDPDLNSDDDGCSSKDMHTEISSDTHHSLNTDDNHNTCETSDDPRPAKRRKPRSSLVMTAFAGLGTVVVAADLF